MNVPDYISPVVAYRVWRWDAAELKSVCEEPWHSSQPLAARCRVYSAGTIVGRAEAGHDAHDAPEANCTCGVYAAKSFEHLRTTGYERYGIHGEVHLWGKVVEHELGYRAQLAYPKNFFLSPDALPFTLAEMQSRLKMLTTYRIDIFLADPKGNIPLWAKDRGYDAAGLGYLIEMSKRYYDRHRLERTLKKGDRVAIIGRGIAVVEHADAKGVYVVLWNRSMLKIGRKEIVWDEGNMRWESHPSTCEVCGQPGQWREGSWTRLCATSTRTQGEQRNMAELSHEQLWHVCQRKPSDFEPYGERRRLTASGSAPVTPRNSESTATLFAMQDQGQVSRQDKLAVGRACYSGRQVGRGMGNQALRFFS